MSTRTVLHLDDDPFPLLDDPDLHRPSFIEDLVQSYLYRQETEAGTIEEMSESEQDRDMAEYEKSDHFRQQVQKRRSEGGMEKFSEEDDLEIEEYNEMAGTSKEFGLDLSFITRTNLTDMM